MTKPYKLFFIRCRIKILHQPFLSYLLLFSFIVDFGFWQQFFATGALNSRKCSNPKKRDPQKVTELFGLVVEFCGRSERSIRTVKTNERDLSLSLYLSKIKMKSSIIKISKQAFLSLFLVNTFKKTPSLTPLLRKRG